MGLDEAPLRVGGRSKKTRKPFANGLISPKPVRMIEKDKVVSIHYKLTNDAGETLDSSEGRDPLSYLHGRGNIVPGLEKALEGREEGDKFKAEVGPDEGYGHREEARVQKVPRENIQAEALEPGTQLEANTPQGPVPLTVTEVDDQEVTVDANHILAGENLHFDIEVVGVRDAAQEELEHGHAH